MAMLERASIDRRILARLLAAGVALGGMAPLAAQTWDWTYALPAPPIDLAPIALSAPDANGFWALGRGLVHYRADRTPDVVRNAYHDGGALSAALADGGIAFTNEPYPHGGPFGAPYGCSVTTYSAQGEPRWTTIIPESISYCTRVGVDHTGALWLQGSQAVLYQLGIDGTQLGSWSDPPIADFAIRDGAPGVYIATNDTPARVIAVPRVGASEWTWTDADATHLLQKLVRGSDGNLYAVGRVNGAAAGTLVVASVTPDGTQRFVRMSADTSLGGVLDVLPAPNGTLFVLDSGSSTTQCVTLHRIAADGSVQWARALKSGCYNNGADGQFSVTAQGDALVAVHQPWPSSGLLVYRYDAAGNEVSAPYVDATDIGALVGLANGDALLTAGYLGDVLHFVQFDRSGASATGPAAQQLLDRGYSSASFATVADGSTYVGAIGEQQAVALAKVDADGALAWRIENARGYQLVADNEQVCALSASGLQCYAGADGTPRWSYAFTPANATVLRALSDGGIEAAGPDASGTMMQRVFDRAGKLVLRMQLPRDSEQMAIGANGTLVTFGHGNQELRAFDRSGAAVFTIAVPFELQSPYALLPPDIQVGPDGAVLVTRLFESSFSITPYRWSVSPQGDTRWAGKLRAGVGVDDGYSSAAGVIGEDGNVYFVLRDAPVPALVRSYSVTVQKRSRDSGALRWQDDEVLADTYGSELLLSPAGDRLLLLGHDQHTLRSALIDSGTGTILRNGVLPCPADVPASGVRSSSVGCNWQAALLGVDGTLHASAFVSNASNASAPYAFALHGALDVAPLLASQPGMDGAWFAPYESGQGFMLDYIPGAGVFMPWFTYADDDNGNDPSKLAWYVLQGGDCCDGSNGPPGIAFTIQRADPGTFAAGAVGVEKVGAARMEFHDCNAAVLSYVFDARGAAGRGRSGSIALQRLTPSTNPCQLDAAHATPAQIANAPTDGFDARQSGSWFDPALGGQGLQFEIIPRGDGFDGLVFGAWFTFDPAGHADDDTHEHWFTLQGNLAHAAHGQTDLVIARTLGGSFDGQATGNTVRVGHAALTMQGCDRAGPDPQQRARLDYAFDAADAAHAFAALSGTLNLVKLGGCSGP